MGMSGVLEWAVLRKLHLYFQAILSCPFKGMYMSPYYS